MCATQAERDWQEKGLRVCGPSGGRAHGRFRFRIGHVVEDAVS